MIVLFGATEVNFNCENYWGTGFMIYCNSKAVIII